LACLCHSNRAIPIGYPIILFPVHKTQKGKTLASLVGFSSCTTKYCTMSAPYLWIPNGNHPALLVTATLASWLVPALLSGRLGRLRWLKPFYFFPSALMPCLVGWGWTVWSIRCMFIVEPMLLLELTKQVQYMVHT